MPQAVPLASVKHISNLTGMVELQACQLRIYIYVLSPVHVHVMLLAFQELYL